MSKHVVRPLTYTNVLRFWFPLALMWVVMGVELPVINAFIARTAGAEKQLAAFGLSFVLCLIIEGPVIQLLSAATALVKGRQAYHSLLRFVHIISLGLTALHLLIALTPLFDMIIIGLMEAPPELLELSRRSFLVSFPWTAAIAYRRFWQGVLIRYGKTRQVSQVMFLRIACTIVFVSAAFALLPWSGAVIGGLALVVGVTSGAAAARVYMRPVLREMEESEPDDRLTLSGITRFYYPLALTSLITMASRPILSGGLGRGLYPLESLAVWPVIISFSFLFEAIPLSYQEAVVALLQEKRDYRVLRSFRNRMAAVSLGAFVLVAVTPLSYLWFRYAAGLEPGLLSFTGWPILFMMITPLPSAFISWYRALNVYRKRTKDIAWAVMVNTAALGLFMYLGIRFIPLAGVVAAGMAYTLALTCEALLLRWRSPHHLFQED